MSVASSTQYSASNTVVRNTYTLLAVTMVIAAIAGFFGLSAESREENFGLYFLVSVALLFSIAVLRKTEFSILLVCIFSAWLGYWTGPMVQKYLSMEYGPQIVVMSMVSTAALFFLLSYFAHKSKENFSYMGAFLNNCLLGLLILAVFGFFSGAPFSMVAYSYIGLVLMSGYILYDTSEIIHGGQDNYILATVDLYLDVLNVFRSFLRLIADFFGKSDPDESHHLDVSSSGESDFDFDIDLDI